MAETLKCHSPAPQAPLPVPGIPWVEPHGITATTISVTWDAIPAASGYLVQYAEYAKFTKDPNWISVRAPEPTPGESMDILAILSGSDNFGFAPNVGISPFVHQSAHATITGLMPLHHYAFRVAAVRLSAPIAAPATEEVAAEQETGPFSQSSPYLQTRSMEEDNRAYTADREALQRQLAAFSRVATEQLRQHSMLQEELRRVRKENDVTNAEMQSVRQSLTVDGLKAPINAVSIHEGSHQAEVIAQLEQQLGATKDQLAEVASMRDVANMRAEQLQQELALERQHLLQIEDGQVQTQPLVQKIEQLHAQLALAQEAQTSLRQVERRAEALERENGALLYDLEAAREALAHLQQLHAAAVETRDAHAVSQAGMDEAAALRAELVGWQHKLAGVEEQSKRCQELLSEADQTIARLQQQESVLQGVVQQSAEKEATLLQELTALREAFERQRVEHEKAAASVTSLHDRYLSSVNEIQVLNERLRSVTESSKPDTASDSKLWADEKEKLLQALRGMHQELMVLRATTPADAIVQERDRLREELGRLQASRPADAAAEADQLRKVVQQMTVHVTAMGEQRDAALSKLAQLEGLYTDLQRAHNSLVAQCQGMQQALEEANARLALTARADFRPAIGGPPELGRSTEQPFPAHPDHSRFEDPVRPSFEHRPPSQFSKVLGSPEQVSLAEELSGMGYKREACIEAARRYTSVGPAVAWLIDAVVLQGMVPSTANEDLTDAMPRTL